MFVETCVSGHDRCSVAEAGTQVRLDGFRLDKTKVCTVSSDDWISAHTLCMDYKKHKNNYDEVDSHSNKTFFYSPVTAQLFQMWTRLHQVH